MKRSREIDRSEFKSSKSALETRKNLSRRELTDKEETKRLLKLLPMKTRTPQSSR